MTLGQLETKIRGLNLDDGSSNPFDYFSVYDDFVEVLGVSGNADRPRLREILGTFRNKLVEADLEEFNDLRRWARKLDEAFTSKSVGELIQAIRNRNVAVPELLRELKDEIEKGNDDAEFLLQIKNAIENGTKTIDELEALVDEMSATGTSAKARILALIAAARNISSTFLPTENPYERE